MEVVLDTNFWLLPGRTKSDVLSTISELGLKPVLLEPVFTELQKLSEGSSKTSQASRIALLLIKQKGLKTVRSSVNYADTAIQLYCQQHNAAAATQDGSLRRELRKLGIPLVTANRSGIIRAEEQCFTNSKSKTTSASHRTNSARI